MNNILVIGAVNSTACTIKQLVKHNFNIVGVLGHEPLNKERVSGWVDLKTLSVQLSLPYKGFQKINDKSNIDWAKTKKPDIIFAVGFSQLLLNDWLQMPTLGCIGFHPTKLPKGRGRAPLAWSVLEQEEGAATFFLMQAGADDGPIFVQKVFPIENTDNAWSVRNKIESSIDKALDYWLPRLKGGEWNPIPQDEAQASWYGKRSPEDGIINWNDPAYLIDKLIKASSHPHPGAYTYFDDLKITIWESNVESNYPIKGVVGRVLIVSKEKGYLIQCGDGLIWIRELTSETNVSLKVGDKLGYNVEDEIYQIKNKLKNLQNE